MKVLRFGLGIRFDVMAGEEEQPTPEQLWEEVFSVLTAGDIKGMHVYGGHVAYESEDSCYICVFTNGKLKKMRRVFRKLNEDAGIGMYLTPTRPFLQTNALNRIEGLTFYGRVQSDGSMTGGDETLFVQAGKKRGKQRPAGLGIVFLLAPDAYGASLTSKQAIRRLTIAARKTFRGVYVLPLPIVRGGPGTVDAVLSAANGIRRAAQVKGPDGNPIQAYYAVLKGQTAVIELPEAYCDASVETGYIESYGLGELIRRALDEGISTIVLGGVDSNIQDCGLGCLRALGAKMLDAEGKEIAAGADEMERLHSIDTEYLHSRIATTQFILMTDRLQHLSDASGQNVEMAGVARLGACMRDYCGQDMLLHAGAMAAVMGATMMCYCGAKPMHSMQALLEVTEMARRLPHVSLVVSGAQTLGKETLAENQPAGALLRLCQKHNIPLAYLAGSMEEGAEMLLKGCNCSVFEWDAHNQPASSREAACKQYDSAAHRMFSFIKLGGDIERVSAKKSKT